MRVEFIYEPEQQGTATSLELQRHTPQEAQVSKPLLCRHDVALASTDWTWVLCAGADLLHQRQMHLVVCCSP